MRTVYLKNGVAIRANFSKSETLLEIEDILKGKKLKLITADPPYGGIVDEEWDKTENDIAYSNWMVDAANNLRFLCEPGASMYWFGGYGTSNNRPFWRFLIDVEMRTEWQISTLITWKKKRAYGLPYKYLDTREEILHLVNGDPKRPLLFNVPLLEKERGYTGYDSKYPAKSKFLRRTNVWNDVTEILRGKKHKTQKPERLYEIMIETHTKQGDWVLDPFAGSGTLARACKKLNRRFILVEKSKKEFAKMLENI
jgi:DNA modification methylase